MVKTYLWINATASSRKTRISNTKEIVLIIKMLFAHRAIKMWPAVILADRRTESVIGRISCLAVSIITINCDRAKGVLRGTKWLKKWLVFLEALKIIKDIQKGRAKHSVKSIWAEKVNTYGIRPVILIKRININMLTSIFDFPSLLGLFKAAKISLEIK